MIENLNHTSGTFPFSLGNSLPTAYMITKMDSNPIQGISNGKKKKKNLSSTSVVMDDDVERGSHSTSQVLF